jgi:hypothetical protein
MVFFKKPLFQKIYKMQFSTLSTENNIYNVLMLDKQMIMPDSKKIKHIRMNEFLEFIF